tara:strand:+ start:996 stop:1277 length:282 start_codon:yes stop_codon:yes gene_type:complete
MPAYSYLCEDCGDITSFSLSINDFKKISSSNENKLLCSFCSSKKLKRIIKPVSNKVEKRKDEIVQEAKREARAIINKIKSGDQRSIRDVFGEE